jgi:hypothetical protein
MIASFELNVGNAWDSERMLKEIQDGTALSENFATNPEFTTPVLAAALGDFASDDAVVVYPEVTFGNPLKAKNVVRWMLYTPGETVPQVYYGFDELHFLYDKSCGRYQFPRCHTSMHIIAIAHVPLDLYLHSGDNQDRTGVAYCVRKSKRLVSSELLNDGILIDGKEHVEIAEIFKSVKTFISYDLYTAYSKFASIAGCDSIIVPLIGSTREELFPDPEQLNGIAYGYDDLANARASRSKLVSKFKEIEQRNLLAATNFVDEVAKFFGE